ncbi:uncharacterized protein BXZ73DRAFT_8336, partial [Epithele typhae]|uniref:uncharacterized protein n=1 Tax=Epithele typhae TaxID=378194 RepID=UPI002008C09D
ASAPVPSSSSSKLPSSSSAPLATPRPSRKDVFRPRFPLDPFAGAPPAALAEPWFIKTEPLFHATSLRRSNVILILGAPTLEQIAPILQSRQLSKSLVILATHRPPDIPGVAIPSVRILHLSAPLALEDAGAVRFVTVLEWAERVARLWRKHGGDGVLELSEDVDINSELAPPSALRFGSQSTPASPGSSSMHLSSDSVASSTSRRSSRFASRPSSMAALSIRQKKVSLPPPDPSQRPFDALVNFLPEQVSDKALLKNSILVTTISRPFLTSSVHPSAARSRANSSSSPRPRSIFNAFSRSTTSVYLSPTPPYHSGDSLPLVSSLPAPLARSLLVHLLPPPHRNESPSSRRRLVESVEGFLVSFAFQSAVAPPQPPRSSRMSSSGGIGMGWPGPSPLERARPYVMEASTFRGTVSWEPGLAAEYEDWTVADVVLCGALDADVSASPIAAQKATKMAKRAWIANAADLIIMPSGSPDNEKEAASTPS